MKKIRLSEKDLQHIVKRVIKEQGEEIKHTGDKTIRELVNSIRKHTIDAIDIPEEDKEIIVNSFIKELTDHYLMDQLFNDYLDSVMYMYNMTGELPDLNENKKHRLKEDVSEYHTDGWANYEKMPVKYFVDSIVDAWYHDEYGDMWEDMSPEQVAKHIESEKENVLNNLSDMVFGYLSGTAHEREW